jgi:type IX secretion system PorP/SprF family membrane protein
MKKITTLIAGILLCSAVKAQDPHFSQFFASPLTLNPALTGKFDGMWRLTANHRNQWLAIDRAFVTTSFSFDMPILKNSIPEGDVFGIGVSGLNDASSSGILNQNYLSLSTSYHRALDENRFNTIGVGFQGTYSSVNLKTEKLFFEDQLGANGWTGVSQENIGNNAIIANVKPYFDFNAGVLFSGSTNGVNNYYAGISLYHINRPSVQLRERDAWKLTNRLTFQAGGSFSLSDNIGLNVSAIHQVQNKASETILGGNLSFYAGGSEDRPTNLYAGSWYRLNDAIIPFIGLEFGSTRLGISRDITVSNLKDAVNQGNAPFQDGFEFSIIFVKQPEQSKGIPCPRY